MSSFNWRRFWITLLVMFACCCSVLALASQSFFYAQPDPRLQAFSGSLTDYGLDSYRNYLSVATGVSALFVCLLGSYRAGKIAGMRFAKELFLMVLIPMAVYFGGLYTYNNCGLGG